MEEWVDVSGEVMRATERAVLIAPDDENMEPEWVPRSCIADGDELHKGDDDVFSIKRWKADALGWVE